MLNFKLRHYQNKPLDGLAIIVADKDNLTVSKKLVVEAIAAARLAFELRNSREQGDV
jgi:hypothetical protein